MRKYLDGCTFVDVGANVGLVSLLVADKVQHAVLFEPNPIAVIPAKEHLPEIVFAAPYLLSLYLLQLSDVGAWKFPTLCDPDRAVCAYCGRALASRGSAPLWMVAPVTAVLAASSAIGIANVVHLLRLKH